MRRQTLQRRPGRRRKLAGRRDVEDMRSLAMQARIETPRAIWAGDVRDATQRLKKHLAHKRQPDLFSEIAEVGAGGGEDLREERLLETSTVETSAHLGEPKGPR